MKWKEFFYCGIDQIIFLLFQIINMEEISNYINKKDWKGLVEYCIDKQLDVYFFLMFYSVS